MTIRVVFVSPCTLLVIFMIKFGRDRNRGNRGFATPALAAHASVTNLIALEIASPRTFHTSFWRKYGGVRNNRVTRWLATPALAARASVTRN